MQKTRLASGHPELEERVPTNDPLYKSSGNVLLNQVYDAEIHYLPEGENEALVDARLDELAMNLQQKGHKPFVIHLGVDHPPFGALGYALAATELRIQLQEQSINATHLITPSGSGITHSGVLAGVDALNRDISVEGICVRRDKSLQKPRIEKKEPPRPQRCSVTQKYHRTRFALMTMYWLLTTAS